MSDNDDARKPPQPFVLGPLKEALKCMPAPDFEPLSDDEFARWECTEDETDESDEQERRKIGPRQLRAQD